MFFVVSQVITLYQFWIHTRLINKMPAWFEYVFNTPSHHRVHHGVNPQYIDKNHAGTLIIWDRMFGTFMPEQEEVVYGITKQAKSWNPVYVNFEYWKDLSTDLRKTSTWRNRAALLIKAPGWKPAELGGVSQLKPVTPATFNKYDTEISAGLTRYVLFQFVIILAASTAFLIFQGQSPINDSLGLKVGLAGLIVLSLLNIGGIFEKKRWVLVFEYARIVILAAVIIVLLNNEKLSNALGISTVVLSLISLIWFSFYIAEFKSQTPIGEFQTQTSSYV